jgi:NitT/TauT family transport system permease protein
MPSPDTTTIDSREVERGLDQLELTLPPRRSRGARTWSALWPKLAAVALTLLLWQLVVWSGWKEEYQLPPPGPVFDKLVSNFDVLVAAAGVTMQRAAFGFGLALLIGTAIGALVVRIPVLRSAVGSLITGLQTMPSIAWFPLAIVLFQLTEGAIMFVVILGAAPSIANGLISGVDSIPPLLLRTGRVLGANGLATFRHVVLPAALPSFIGGLKQGWAFAWRSLLAGELLVIIPGKSSLGQRLQFSAELEGAPGLISVMIVILVIGILIDALLFGTAERVVRRRYGLIDAAAT